MRLMNCGDERLSRPSMGAWITYGLGTENAEPARLHRHVPRPAGRRRLQLASRPSCPASTRGPTSTPASSRVEDLIENIQNPTVTRADQRRQLDLLTELNRRHLRAAGRGRRPRGADRQLRAGLPHADGRHRRLRRRAGAAVRPRRLRAGRPGPAAPDRPPPDRAGRAVRPALSRRRPALGQPRPHRGEPPQAGPGSATRRSRRF